MRGPRDPRRVFACLAALRRRVDGSGLLDATVTVEGGEQVVAVVVALVRLARVADLTDVSRQVMPADASPRRVEEL